MDYTAINPTWIWIALGAIAVLMIAVLMSRGARRSRSAELRDKFGPEYDHAVNEVGSRKKAERELVARAQEVQRYDIHPLNASQRDRYKSEWQRVEQRFVERPTTAVAEADELVADIMRVQGYPIGDFDKHAADLSVKHPRIVEHYRAGHNILVDKPGQASTEELRQAMLHYRALFEQLIGERGDDVVQDVPLANEVVTAPREPRVLRDDDDRDLNRRQ